MAAHLRQPNGEAALEVGEKMNEGNRLMNLAAIEMLQLKAGDRILEIGMGNGFFVKLLFDLQPDIHYTGCDFSEAMVNESKKRNADLIAQQKATFVLASAEKLPQEANSISKIFTVNTIYFWEDPTAVFSELKRVLKPAGELILAVRPKAVMEKFPVTRYGFNMFSQTELKQVLEQHGFTPVAAEEKMEGDLEVFGEKLQNGYLVIRAVKK